MRFLRYQARLGRLLARLGRLRARLGRLREIWGMPKMRWCFTRFRHAARTARGVPKCVGTSLGLGCRALHARTRLGAYATRCFRSWSWTKTLLLRTYAARFCARTRRGVGRTRCGGLFRGVYSKVYPPQVSVVNRRTGASGGVAQNALVLH